jgi:hypothetical protein
MQISGTNLSSSHTPILSLTLGSQTFPRTWLTPTNHYDLVLPPLWRTAFRLPKSSFQTMWAFFPNMDWGQLFQNHTHHHGSQSLQILPRVPRAASEGQSQILIALQSAWGMERRECYYNCSWRKQKGTHTKDKFWQPDLLTAPLLTPFSRFLWEHPFKARAHRELSSKRAPERKRTNLDSPQRRLALKSGNEVQRPPKYCVPKI